jgi:hypothetical protein
MLLLPVMLQLLVMFLSKRKRFTTLCHTDEMKEHLGVRSFILTSGLCTGLFCQNKRSDPISTCPFHSGKYPGDHSHGKVRDTVRLGIVLSIVLP